MTIEEKTSIIYLPKKCLLSMDYGNNCELITTKWYFDPSTKLCYPFEYTGCGPFISNRFEDNEECQKTCVYNINNESINFQNKIEIKTTTKPIENFEHCKS
jgi:hypothetical protein